ncbi:Hypothetical protein PFR_JS9-2_561 [Propionibacterium freudenreichii]|nr:Hypothetical protein PFR_JS9-1_563 [Propionibacterium freudenreichii]SCQ67161.1 Hypothetical protein PFR_JS9-2_561 [Propionibacterium freudenreichii]
MGTDSYTWAMTSRTRVMTTLTTEDAPAAVPDGFAAPVAAPLDAGSPTPRVEVAAAIAPPATVEEPADPGPALDAVEPATEGPARPDHALRGRRFPVPHQYGPRRSPSADPT